MLQLMDSYCGGWAILTIGLCECIAVGWVYGKKESYDSIPFSPH